MAVDLFQSINKFAELNTIKDDVILHFAGNQLQNETSDTCGIFQVYFYKNHFDPLKKNKKINDNKLTKNTALILLNKLFPTFDEENEQMIEQFPK